MARFRSRRSYRKSYVGRSRRSRRSRRRSGYTVARGGIRL